LGGLHFAIAGKLRLAGDGAMVAISQITTLRELEMGFFGSLFGTETKIEKKKEVSDEIDISEAVAAHVSWKLRLQKCLDGTSEEKLDADVVCRDDQCKLGKWIHGSALKHFDGLQAFLDLREDHATFHQLAGQIVRHAQVNEHAYAHALMEGDYKHVSHRVVMGLTELNEELVG